MMHLPRELIEWQLFFLSRVVIQGGHSSNCSTHRWPIEIFFADHIARPSHRPVFPGSIPSRISRLTSHFC